MNNNFPVIFDSNDLSLIDGIIMYNYDANDLPTRDIKMYKLARQDKSIITTGEYSSKTITCDGWACGSTRAEAEIAMLELKSLLNLTNRPLILEQYGTDIEYTATLNGISSRWYNNKYMFTLQFICPDPIGRETVTSTLLTTSNITTQTTTLPIDNEGSFICEPIFSIVVNAVTGGTAAYISISNQGIGQGITITRDWIAGDIVEIDCTEKNVTVNGARVDYSGLFPFFYSGIGTVGYVDTFSTRDVDVSATYVKRYI